MKESTDPRYARHHIYRGEDHIIVAALTVLCKKSCRDNPNE